MKLWEKGASAEDWVTRFTVGDDWKWDTFLLPFDIEGTRTHAMALHRIDLLTDVELTAISDTLDKIGAEVIAGGLSVRREDEDAHTVIENELTERLGDIGKKIHAGRSRNDQVLVALRLFLRDRLLTIGRELTELGKHLCTLAEKYASVWMPGYTHMQHAMPTTAGLWAAGYAELLVTDLEGIKAAFDKINVSPWGSAAGYGVPRITLPRAFFAASLGFDGYQQNVTAVQLSRGKLEASVVHALVQVSATLNRLSADLVMFTMSEFGFVHLPEAYTTGSSIMPQKRNPDVLELARATHHRISAELSLLLGLPSNLPSGYHRDLQLTKEAVMRAVFSGGDLVTAVRHVVEGLQFEPDAMRSDLSPELFATDKALSLVKQGMPFREAYRETASQLGGLEVPEREELNLSYNDAGLPGRPATETLRRELAGVVNWLQSKQEACNNPS